MRHIKVNQLSKTFKGNTLFNNLSFEVKGGTILGISGPNGSGKSVLFKIICGLLKPTSGEVYIDGKLVGKEIETPPSTGILIENPQFINVFTGFENLKFLTSLNTTLSDEAIHDFLKLVGLNKFANVKYKKYSLGMKQRLGIAQAIMENQSIVLLDEPSNGLDEKGIQLISNIILQLKEQNKIVLLTSHDKEFLHQLSDDVIAISEYGGDSHV